MALTRPTSWRYKSPGTMPPAAQHVIDAKHEAKYPERSVAADDIKGGERTLAALQRSDRNCAVSRPYAIRTNNAKSGHPRRAHRRRIVREPLSANPHPLVVKKSLGAVHPQL